MEIVPDQITSPPLAERYRGGARLGGRHRREGMESLTIGQIASRNRRIYYQAIAGLGAVMLAGQISVAISDPAMAWTYAMIATCSLVPLWVWASHKGKGVPILPMFVVQQVLVYLMPIFVRNETIQGYDSTVMSKSALSVVVFFLLLPLGWKWGRIMVASRSSRWNFNLRGRGGVGVVTQRIALIFLGVSIGFEVFSKLGLTGSIPSGVMPVIRAILGALAAFGAFLGAFVIAGGRGVGGRISYWLSFYLLFFLTASGLLLSGVTLMVVAAGTGLGLGGARIPWRFVVGVSAILTLLNIGKFEMRAKYWSETVANTSVETAANSSVESVANTRLAGTLSIYAEWIEVSFDILANRLESHRRSVETAEPKGQSLLERMNNLQNMAFVVNAQEVLHMAPLGGKTYSLIPPLFIPRFMWVDKPRTHEGQIMLNVHYGRQGSIEDTERTYIAWGFLPEAVGNFGTLGGALFLGPVLGLLLGMSESWSVRKRLFSIEGLVILGILLQFLISFEMVASVFLTSTFQMVVVLAAGGAMFRMALAKAPDVSRRRAR